MIWDTIMFAGELDMLEVRLTEMEPYPVRHVITEATLTHRGEPRRLVLGNNWDRFARWHDRIAYITVDRLPAGPDPWVREHHQRDAAMEALDDAASGDLVLIADVDEIPSPAAMAAVPETAAALNMRMAMYAADWLYPVRHLCSVLATAGYVRGIGSLASLRDARNRMPVAGEGGWHLTWLGGVQAQRQKLARTCHTEMTEFEAGLIRKGRCYREGIHHSGRLYMIPADVDETWPQMIRERRVPQSWFRPRGDS